MSTSKEKSGFHYLTCFHGSVFANPALGGTGVAALAALCGTHALPQLELLEGPDLNDAVPSVTENMLNQIRNQAIAVN